MGILSFFANLFKSDEPEPKRPLPSASSHSSGSRGGEHSIRFDPKLIERLKWDHAQIYESFVAIGKHSEAGDWSKSKESLHTFAKTLERHLVLESIRFYKYVEHELRDDVDSIEVVSMFKSEMDSIGEVLKSFLEKYEAAASGKPWSEDQKASLPSDLKGIGDALVSRVQREESTLYPLYRD